MSVGRDRRCSSKSTAPSSPERPTTRRLTRRPVRQVAECDLRGRAQGFDGTWGYVQGSPLGQGNANLFPAPVGLRSVEADRRRIPRGVTTGEIAMTMKTLIDAVADRTGETKARTAVTVEAVFTEIAAQLAAGNDVTLPGVDHVGHFRSRISERCSTRTLRAGRCPAV